MKNKVNEHFSSDTDTITNNISNLSEYIARYTNKNDPNEVIDIDIKNEIIGKLTLANNNIKYDFVVKEDDPYVLSINKINGVEYNIDKIFENKIIKTGDDINNNIIIRSNIIINELDILNSGVYTKMKTNDKSFQMIIKTVTEDSVVSILPVKLNMLLGDGDYNNSGGGISLNGPLDNDLPFKLMMSSINNNIIIKDNVIIKDPILEDIRNYGFCGIALYDKFGKNKTIFSPGDYSLYNSPISNIVKYIRISKNCHASFAHNSYKPSLEPGSKNMIRLINKMRGNQNSNIHMGSYLYDAGDKKITSFTVSLNLINSGEPSYEASKNQFYKNLPQNATKLNTISIALERLSDGWIINKKSLKKTLKIKYNYFQGKR